MCILNKQLHVLDQVSSDHNSHVLTLFFSPLFFKVFTNSGFSRTLCGGAWESISGWLGAFNNLGSSTARLGCCSPGTFMAKPTLNPFSTTTACEACPAGQHGSSVDDDITSCNANPTCDDIDGSGTDFASCVDGKNHLKDVLTNTCATGTCTASDCCDANLAIPDCTYSGLNDRSCGLRQAVDAYITSGTTGSYGPIEDWDTSLVTDLSYVFKDKSSFNADISKWITGAVTSMERSKCTFSLPLSVTTASVIVQFEYTCTCTTTRVSSDHNSHTFCCFVVLPFSFRCLWWVGLSFLCCTFSSCSV
jgi:surface protein